MGPMFSEDMFDRMDLQMLRSLMPTMTLDEQAELNQPEGHYDSRPPKWQRSGQKGPGNGGKGRHPATPQHSGNAWSGNDWAQRRPQDNRPKHPPQGAFRHSRQQPQDRDHADQMVKQLAELKAINMLTTLVLRQEVQLNIHKQDTAYVLFLNTQGQDSMAGSLFHIGAQWHKTKSEDPTKLTAPVRVIMFQHLIKRTQERFQTMLATPSARSQAQAMGYLRPDGKIPGLRWDPQERQHVLDDSEGSRASCLASA